MIDSYTDLVTVSRTNFCRKNGEARDCEHPVPAGTVIEILLIRDAGRALGTALSARYYRSKPSSFLGLPRPRGAILSPKRLLTSSTNR